MDVRTVRRMRALVLMLAIACGPSAAAGEPVTSLDEFSPAFLGMYRKVMEIEGDIRRHAAAYGVDVDLARAVCLYESGGNAGLASRVGAQGYFQVMPATFRELNVETNIEAGVKYLGQLIRQFGREDTAVAAYNGGPGRVGRAGGLPLETLQYVVGVGYYRTVLKQHDRALRTHASSLRLDVMDTAATWSELSQRLGLPELELRFHNPFIASRRLRAGDVVAVPPGARRSLLLPTDGGVSYRMRHGDHYINLAHTLGVDLDALRSANAIWHTQVVPTGTILTLPMSNERAGAAEKPLAVAALPAPVSRTTTRPSSAPSPQWYRVNRGDTLGTLATRFNTSIADLQQVNGLRGTTIRAGQRLRIPPALAGR